ncbi:MAG: prepilin-type N-terminal cleavage/methylation domain-containing protein [candidate division WOR-3 bacterium]
MKNKGFTLIEIVVVVVVLGIVVGMIYENFFYNEKALRRQRSWSEMNTKARKASTYISKEIRMIGYSGKDPGRPSQSFGIISGEPNRLVYSHDIDGPELGVVDSVDIHSIELRHDTLYIDGNFAMDNVISLRFTYVDEAGNEVNNFPIREVDPSGNWIFPPGASLVDHIEYHLQILNPFVSVRDTIHYRGLASLRNSRPN